MHRGGKGIMETGRLEAFSDGVLAIIITIMVLEMKVPHGKDLTALVPLWPVFLSYVLSFVYVGIYWNNHHHRLDGRKPLRGHSLGALRSGVADGGHRLLGSAAHHHRGRRLNVGHQECGGSRLERQSVTADLFI